MSLIGLGVALVLATQNLDFLIGGSQPAADTFLGLVYGVFVLGVITAVRYRTSRPEVYARIGRQV